MTEFDENTPLFVISVAAELALMHPQTLRQYDRLGLVSPRRTLGQSRRYTMRNVAQLRQIAALSAEGVSLEGIKRILELENNNAELKQRVRDLEQALANELMNRPGARVLLQGIKESNLWLLAKDQQEQHRLFCGGLAKSQQPLARDRSGLRPCAHRVQCWLTSLFPRKLQSPR